MGARKIERLYTIGFTKKSLRRFVTLLISHGVDAVVDVRLHNTSQLAGWSKKDDLAYILETHRIAYRHEPDVAPTAEMIAAWRSSHDWSAYVRAYDRVIEQRSALGALRAVLEKYDRPCLLCAEAEPTYCHRRLLAEQLSSAQPIETVHLA